MVELKEWNGIMDTDSSQQTIGARSHKMAYNIVFRDNRLENVPGTTEIVNEALPTGVNVTIGGIFDEVFNRIIYFNYNSNNNHGIYIYYTNSKTTATLLQCGSATDGDILGFKLTQPITSVNIIYGDLLDGDILCFLDCSFRPVIINIKQYLTNPYTITKREYIDLAQAPPIMPPHCTYENDTTTTVNNLQNSLFKFYSRFEYDNYLKSVYSSGSITPLPLNPFLPTVGNNGQMNNRISIYVQTGDENVKKIEIWGQQSNNSGTTDYFLIVSLDKSTLSIPDNSIYRFLFYNDALYPFGTIADQTLLQDFVPQQARAQEILNGNTIILANITEGYDLVPIDLSYITTGSIAQPVSTYNGLLFFGSQNGQDSGGTGNTIVLYLTGAGTNDGSGNPTTLSNCKTIFVVDCALSNGTSKKFQYYNSTTSATTAAIFAGLAAAAVTAGFTVVSTTTNTLTITQTDIVLYGAQVLRNGSDTIDITNDATFAYAHQSAYQYGVQYFDEFGRTNGTSISSQGGINTTVNSENLTAPQIQIEINSRPPTWAKYWCLTRTKSLTFNKRLTWVCIQTFKDINVGNNETYAYINIDNISDYNKQLAEITADATPVVFYSYAQGDRISFQVRYVDGVETNSLTPPFDYPILGVVINPSYKGIVQNGTFIKILYPQADISSNFDFGGDNYQNYKILIYNYTKHAIAQNDTVYYEFSKQSTIGKWGTNQAYHIAADQTQSSNLATPAIVNLTEGDYFYRFRTVPAGLVYYIQTETFAHDFSPTGSTLTVSLSPTTITKPTYTLNATNHAGADLDPANYPIYSSVNPNIENTSSGLITVRVRGSFPISANANEPNDSFALYAKINHSDGTTNETPNIIPIKSNMTPQTQYIYEFDSLFQMPAGSKMWFVALGNGNINIGGFQLYLSVLNNITIPVTESSFSDNYNIVTNSNSRPSVYDPNAKRLTFQSAMRWSLADQTDTTINQINKFYPDNFEQISLDRGQIQRLVVMERRLITFQERGIGQLGIYSKYVQDSGGTQLLTTTDSIITKNNVTYYQGTYGLGAMTASIVKTPNAIYFVDPILGEEVRLAQDGLTSLSKIYLGKYYLKSLLVPYILPYTMENGGISQILGAFDFKENQMVRVLQGGTNDGIGQTIDNYAYSFNTARNGFCSFYNFAPEWIVGANDVLYSFLNGILYSHDNTSDGGYTNFYGTTYPSSIKLVFNDKLSLKKSYFAVSYQSNQILVSPTNGDINTEMINPQTGLQQISQLIQQDYQIQENQRYAAFLRDANSLSDAQLALVEGNVLQGKWMEINFVYQGNNFMYLYLPYILTQPSNRNF